MTVLWRYDVKTPAGKWRRLRWAMTEEDAAAHEKRNGVTLRKIEATREERTGGTGLMPSLYKPDASSE